ncbi:hypothetical protein ACFQH5_17985 [Halomonas salifodinae]|uniref:Uncharacterized protein n=1 Tax=Halomonas salifodinae TaxID=438745 RepID=A0ABW2F3F9_9GAMM
MSRIIGGAVISLIFIFIYGCNTTAGRGYVNPEFSDYKLTSVAVYVDNRGDVGELLELGLVNELRRRGVNAVSVRDIARFSNSQEEFVEKVWGLGVSEVVSVVMADSQGSSTYGYQSFGSAYSTGSYTTANFTTTPMRTFHRSMLTTASVFDRQGNKVWEGDTERSAQGLVFIGDRLTVSETTSALIDALSESGLI